MSAILNWLYGGNELQAESDRLDAQLSTVNNDALARGAITKEQYDETNANISRGILDVSGELETSFGEGLKEGQSNIRKTIAAPFNAAFAIIPWQLWVVGGVGLFIYMGGAQYLKGILPRKIS